MGGMLGVVLMALSLFCLVVLGIVMPNIRRHREATNGVINYNADMTKFVYKVYAIKPETSTANCQLPLGIVILIYNYHNYRR